MNDGELNGLVLAAVCLIFYYALRFVMWLWDAEQRRMDEFSSQMDALQSRTQEAEKMAEGLTPDRPGPKFAQEARSLEDINRLLAEIEDK